VLGVLPVVRSLVAESGWPMLATLVGLGMPAPRAGWRRPPDAGYDAVQILDSGQPVAPAPPAW
jgi:hypothetical protein